MAGQIRVFENKVPMKMHGPKREKVIGEVIQLHMRRLIMCTLHTCVIFLVLR